MALQSQDRALCYRLILVALELEIKKTRGVGCNLVGRYLLLEPRNEIPLLKNGINFMRARLP
jgi:hypothetical protein